MKQPWVYMWFFCFKWRNSLFVTEQVFLSVRYSPVFYVWNSWLLSSYVYGNSGKGDRLYFLGLQNHCRWWVQPWKYKILVPWKKSYDKLTQHIKKQRHYFANKGTYSQSYGFSNSHVWMWELDHNEGWVPKNWCFWTVVLEKTVESPLDCKEIQPVNHKGNQSWIFIGRTEAETPILWPSN